LGSYGDVTIIDELHAYAIDDITTPTKRKLGYIPPEPKLREKMRAHFLQHLIKNGANVPNLEEFTS